MGVPPTRASAHFWSLLQNKKSQENWRIYQPTDQTRADWQTPEAKRFSSVKEKKRKGNRSLRNVRQNLAILLKSQFFQLYITILLYSEVWLCELHPLRPRSSLKPHRQWCPRGIVSTHCISQGPPPPSNCTKGLVTGKGTESNYFPSYLSFPQFPQFIHTFKGVHI